MLFHSAQVTAIALQHVVYVENESERPQFKEGSAIHRKWAVD